MRIVNPIGKKGEDLAVEFLKSKKWKILERNYRKHYGEVDIIAIDPTKDEPALVFVEVKTRTSNQFGTPFEAITFWKIQPLLKAIRLYVATNRRLPQLQRIDAIAVTLPEGIIEHMENITGS